MPSNPDGSRPCVVLRQRLGVYGEPDTATPRIGWIEAGVAEYDRTHEVPDTSYVHLPGVGWVCRAWREHEYATLEDAATFVPESALIDRLRAFVGWGYHKSDARYPTPVSPDVPALAAPPTRTNCVCFAEALIVGAWRDVNPSFGWGPRDRNQFMVPMGQWYGNIDVTVQRGLGVALSSDTLPPPWTLVQGWQGTAASGGTTYSKGHTFLVLDRDAASGKVLTLEANDFSAYQLSGVGFRHLGNLADFDDMHPGSDWMLAPRLWSWDAFRATYPHRRQAALRVRDVGWVAGGPARWSDRGGALEAYHDEGVGSFEVATEGLHLPLGSTLPDNASDLPTPH